MRRALTIFIGSLGVEHPNSISVRMNCVALLQANRRTVDEIDEDLTFMSEPQ